MMQIIIMDITGLLTQKESGTLEFKETLRMKEEICAAVSAFSNASGGTILIGVTDAGAVKGLDVGKKTTTDLAEYIKKNTDPNIFPDIRVHEIEDMKIISVMVKESHDKPVFYRGRAYKRVSDTSPKINSSEIRALAKESAPKVYWDGQVCESATLDDIDERKVREFLRNAKLRRGLKIDESSSVRDVLIQLNLMRERKLTNTGVLMFGKNPNRFFLQNEVKCIRFDGNEPVKPYIDFQTLEGNVPDLVDMAEDFVLRNIRKAIWLVPGQIQREEKHEYPPDAIREAIVNAIVHRDYLSPSKVQVRVFNDYIEVWSPGVLHEELKLDDLRKKHKSIPRNPLLFKQFFWIKYVEDVGGGTLDMIDECKKWGLPEPVFEHITGAFVVTFKLPLRLEDLEKSGLNERQVKAVEYVMKKISIGNKEYRQLNNISKRIATLELADLVKRAIFSRVGKGKRDIRYLLVQKYPKSIQKSIQKENQGNDDMPKANNIGNQK